MRVFVAIAIGLVVVFSISFVFMESFGLADEGFIRAALDGVLDRASGRWLLAGLIAGLLVSDLLLPVPSSILMILSGYFFGLEGALVSFAGALAGAILGFALCRLFGRRAVRRILDDSEILRVEQFFHRYGAWAVLLSRAVPMATEVVSCLAGMSAMSWRRFMVLSALGTLPLCLVYAWAGAYAGGSASSLAVWVAVIIPAASFAIFRLLFPKVS